MQAYEQSKETDMKTLVIVTHPDIQNSATNKRWVQELSKYPDQYTIHNLHEIYPDGIIDVAKEQATVEAHGNVILQFPFYWFNCPPLLKKWLDDVLQYRWAYGTGGEAFKGRKVALAVTAGIRKTDFAAEGKWKHSLEQLLAPFTVTLKYIQADYQGLFAFYGVEDDAEQPDYAARLEQSATDYVSFLAAI